MEDGALFDSLKTDTTSEGGGQSSYQNPLTKMMSKGSGGGREEDEEDGSDSEEEIGEFSCNCKLQCLCFPLLVVSTQVESPVCALCLFPVPLSIHFVFS